MLIEVLGSLRFWFSGDGLEMVALRARGSAQIQDHYHTSRFTQTPSTVIQLLQHQFRFFGRANGARRLGSYFLLPGKVPCLGLCRACLCVAVGGRASGFGLLGVRLAFAVLLS